MSIKQTLTAKQVVGNVYLYSGVQQAVDFE